MRRCIQTGIRKNPQRGARSERIAAAEARLVGRRRPLVEGRVTLLHSGIVYPSERDRIPRWLFDELLLRARQHADLPLPQTRICRG